MINFVNANRGEANWSGNFVSKDSGACRAKVGIYKLTGDYPMAEESLSISKMSVAKKLVRYRH